MSDLAETWALDLAEGTKFFTTAKEHYPRLKETFTKGKVPGETTHFKILDENLTLRMGFIYCFTGWPGSGKSEFITQLSVLQAYYKSRKVAFYSPESYPVDEFIDSIIHCYLGKSTDSRFVNVCTAPEYDEAVEWVDKRYMFCDWSDTPDCETVLNAFKHLNQIHKVSIFVIDPFNSLETTGEELNIAVALKKNLTAVKRFAQQNRVMIWLVEHPKTPSKPEEFDLVPGNRQLFGGTMWWNKIDVGVTVHRPNREDKHDRTVMIKTWKVKRQQLNGTPGEQSLYYDIRTNRYYPDQYCLDHPMKIMSRQEIIEENDSQPF